MIYINTVTRATIDSPTPIFGGDWILKDKEEKEETVAPIEPVEEIEEDAEVVENDMGELTKADIMQELDAFGIEYNKKDTKAELYELMMSRK